ncbi:uncharacterized protein L199_004497 [Kwoniella botswanensis]|uniref:uncharacterized protein n=1 Tax=Kwoniella botswanensis TaxID=1268659 RepID=UPI00315D507D
MNYTPGSGSSNGYPMMIPQSSTNTEGTFNSQQQQQQGQPTMVNPADLAMIARQGYLQQQQQLANINQQYGARQMYGMTPQMQQEQIHRQLQAQQAAVAAAQAQAAQAQAQAQAQGQGQNQPGRKKRGPKPSVGSQMIARQTASFQPPNSQEHYMKNAMAVPTSSQQAQTQIPPQGVSGEPVEPWADALDELDPREIAMGRFRKRHEVLSEVFSPDAIKDIPNGEYDPWTGLGMDSETLEAKVLALEKENEELEARSNTIVEDFKKRLQDIDAGVDVSRANAVEA